MGKILVTGNEEETGSCCENWCGALTSEIARYKSLKAVTGCWYPGIILTPPPDNWQDMHTRLQADT